MSSDRRRIPAIEGVDNGNGFLNEELLRSDPAITSGISQQNVSNGNILNHIVPANPLNKLFHVARSLMTLQKFTLSLILLNYIEYSYTDCAVAIVDLFFYREPEEAKEQEEAEAPVAPDYGAVAEFIGMGMATSGLLTNGQTWELVPLSLQFLLIVDGGMPHLAPPARRSCSGCFVRTKPVAGKLHVLLYRLGIDL
ncbi:uncharacterized protein A4U43_C03F7360 [Asparagus officinalis]|uniref:Uncharacterized protein n=1 Tax=Asparagus officinalis TaxID=4686 RepID=A0A5P1F8U5_ASPOF|nr:uncharacterized protein A4U43_C03F7360 [Asparagus officinalis]